MIVKPNQLKLGDVVHYTNARYAFGDMEVVKVDDDGVYLRRPYITNVEAHYEELYWRKDSDFNFVLVETADYEDERWKRNLSCTN